MFNKKKQNLNNQKKSNSNSNNNNQSQNNGKITIDQNKNNKIALDKNNNGQIQIEKNEEVLSKAVKKNEVVINNNKKIKINNEEKTVDEIQIQNRSIFIVKNDKYLYNIDKNNKSKENNKDHNNKFCDIALDKKLIFEKDINRCLTEQQYLNQLGKKTGQFIYIGEVLRKNGFLKDDDIVEIIKEQSGYEFYNVKHDNPKIYESLPFLSNKQKAETLCKIITNNQLCILDIKDKNLILGVINDKQLEIISKQLASIFSSFNIYVYLVSPSNLELMQRRNILNIFFNIDFNEKLKELERIQSQEDIFRELVSYAYFTKSSDIHIEQDDNVAKVYVRTGGDRDWLGTLSKSLSDLLMNSIYIKADMKVENKLTPQDGAIVFDDSTFNIKGLNLRISVIPIVSRKQGNSNISCVIRLLAAGSASINLKMLNVDMVMTGLLEKALEREAGMILVVGPTGSGKSTLLNGLMGSIDKESRAVVTIENPVENIMSGVKQIEIKDKSSGDVKDEKNVLNFKSALRAILRHDPNVIMVGEIRDKETMRIAINAVDTSHLVLGTLHSVNVNKTIHRLINMSEGEIPFTSIIETLLAIVSQRLLKKICPYCSIEEEFSFEKNEINLFSNALQEEVIKDKKIKIKNLNKGGCSKCRNGIVGVVPVNEYVIFNDDIKEEFDKFKKIDLKKHGYEPLEIKLYNLLKQQVIDLDEFRRYL